MKNVCAIAFLVCVMSSFVWGDKTRAPNPGDSNFVEPVQERPTPRSGFDGGTEGTLLHQQDTTRRQIYDLRITLGNLQGELRRRKSEAQRLPKGKVEQKAAEIAVKKVEEQITQTRQKLQQTQEHFTELGQQVAQMGTRATPIAVDAGRQNQINRDRVVGDMVARIPTQGDPRLASLRGGELPRDIETVSQAFDEDRRLISELEPNARVLSFLSQMDQQHLENNIDEIDNLLRLIPEDDPLRGNLMTLKQSIEGRQASKKEREQLSSQEDTPARQKREESIRRNEQVQQGNFDRALNESFTMVNRDIGSTRNDISTRLADIKNQIATQETAMAAVQNSNDEQAYNAANHQLEVLRGREAPLKLALQAASDQPDRTLLTDHGYNDENSPPVDRRIAEVNAEKDILIGTRKMKAQGETQEAIERWQEGMRIATASEAEDTGSCTWWDKTKGVLSGAWDITKTGASWGKWALWDLPGMGLGALGDVFGGIGSFFTTPVKQGLFATFSALAQYQYTQKGSKNENTQIYRGLAMALGLNLGFSGAMPAGMEKFVDPLEPFKREPLAMQNMIANQDQILADVLTIGGNPSNARGYPYSVNDRLQSALQGVAPGSPTFPASASTGFPGMFDPNYQNFSGRAYNGFPPQANIPVGGAYLNPQNGSQSPFYAGSGLASVTRTTSKPSLAKQGLAGLVAATAVEKNGVRNYRQQLEDVNPPDNSMVSVVGEVDRLAARNRELRNRGLTLSQIEEQQNAGYINNMIVRQQARISEQIQKLSDINVRIWEASQKFRRSDIQIQRDDDGLMIGSRRDWSENMEARNAALIELAKLRDERAAALEAIAFIRANPMLFERMLAQQPQVPQPKNNPQQPQELTPFSFLIRPVWAAEESKVSLALDPNWRAIVQEEKQLVQKELVENQKKLEALKPELKKLVDLDPKGVHEINVPILQIEELNMKALALQAHQNLEKLKKAEAKLKDDTAISAQEKAETLTHIKEYRFMLTDLLKESKQCANELAQVERLQREKRERFDMFHHFREIGQQRLEEFPSL